MGREKFLFENCLILANYFIYIYAKRIDIINCNRRNSYVKFFYLNFTIERICRTMRLTNGRRNFVQTSFKFLVPR